MSPLAVIEFEHGELNRILAELGSTDDPRKVRICSAKFAVALRDHIAKEERVLFPEAEKLLGEGKLVSISEKAGLLNEL